MATDPISSALDALVTHLASELGSSATVRRGWPEAAVEMDVGTKPEVAVTASPSPRATLVSPRELDESGSETLTVTYRVGLLEVLVQVDLWCAYRATRDEVAPLVEAALHNQLPRTSGLWLTQDDYYSRPLSFDIEAPGTHEQDAAAGEWRSSWTLRLTTDLVVQTELPETGQIDIQLITELASEYITEITPITP